MISLPRDQINTMDSLFGALLLRYEIHTFTKCHFNNDPHEYIKINSHLYNVI